MRSSLLSEISSDYAAYARTRGLSEWQIILRHGLKNSLPPVITLFGQYLGYMLAGSAVAEKVFFTERGRNLSYFLCCERRFSCYGRLHCDNCGSVCDCKSCSGCDKQVDMPMDDEGDK